MTPREESTDLVGSDTESSSPEKAPRVAGAFQAISRVGWAAGVEAPAALLRSGLRFGWAMSLLGAQGMVQVVRRNGDAMRALDDISSEAQRQLGAPSSELLQSGERLRRDVAELWAGLGEDDAAQRLSGAIFQGGTGGARRALALLAPAFGRGSSLERVADILYVAEQFAETALSPLDVQGRELVTEVLSEAEHLLDLDPFCNLWRLEGLGYAYGDAVWLSEKDPFDLEDLAPSAAMPILTGASLALARRLLVGFSEAGEKTELFVGLCERWAPAGTRLMLFEAAGFISHQLMPLRFEAMAEAARSLGERSRAAFWHGVGRALYLSLRGLTGARGRVERAAALENPLERRNALAGMVWAATLVHLRHPVHLDQFLAQAADLLDRESVRHGAAGALTVWLNHLEGPPPGQEPYLARFIEYRGRSPFWHTVHEASQDAEANIQAFAEGGVTWDRLYALGLEADESRRSQRIPTPVKESL